MQSKNTYHILIEEVEHHSREAGVAPVPVDQQELLQEPEPCHGKVTSHHRLKDEYSSELDVPLLYKTIMIII